ncbi:proline iminopeptidase-family hydrolase [Acetobacterium wieringae]|uniref:proline iminopeptidase-family hydrolase n=1 Tax=Acetobacterium wieringae TaxID=52694 RepID=UPI0026ECECB2|nr:proline iminopeptidase-family hydrolase [Acetobacterium wieringae]
MREDYITYQDKKIWYSVYGEASHKTPLLVVHGGPGFVSIPDVIADFSDDRPVYFYDQLGSGNSDRADDKNDYSVAYFVAELDAVIQGLALREVILLGLSWGCGLIAAYMLEKQPPFVKALILSAPYLSTPLWEECAMENISNLPEAIQKIIVDAEKNQDFNEAYEQATEAYYANYLCRLNPWPDSVTASFGKLNMDVYLTMWGPSEFTVNGKLKHFDLMPRLHEIEVPVLLTCGDHDEAGVKMVKDFQMAFPLGSMAVIPSSAHLHHIEQPLIYKTIVSAFLKDK